MYESDESLNERDYPSDVVYGSDTYFIKEIYVRP